MAKVLVIDECLEFREYACRSLMRSGFEVIEARDGLAGLQRAVEDAPDWILIDAELSGLAGFEICRQIRAEERTRDLPIAIWSSSDDSFDRKRAFESGANDFIVRSKKGADLGERGWALIGRTALLWMRTSHSRQALVR